MSDELPLAVWIRGDLVQTSAWSVGGSARSSAADMAFCRDGQDRLTLTGAALSGAIVDAAAKVAPGWAEAAWYREGPIAAVTCKFDDPKSSELRASALQTWHAHPTDSTPFLRPGVALLHKTRAATGEGGTGALFDIEATPAGTRWPLLLRLDGLNNHAADLEWLLARVLADWAAGLGWLGASVARGMGWFALQNAQVMRLPRTVDGLAADTALWRAGPGGQPPQAAGRIKAEDWTTWVTSKPPAATSPGSAWWHATFAIDITAGARADGWGADFVAVGGHDTADAEQGENPEESQVRRVARMGRQLANPTCLPGSAIRGTLRHAAAALARGAAMPNVLDPAIDTDVADAGKNDPGNAARSAVDAWFGTVNLSSRIVVRDALPKMGSAPVVRKLELHAEDEFTAATYLSAKYTVEAVVAGTFQTVIAIEATTRAELEAGVGQLLPALRLAELGHVPLGADAFAGLGWPSWTVTSVSAGRFGEGVPARLDDKGKGKDEANLGQVADQWKAALAGLAADQPRPVDWRYRPPKAAPKTSRNPADNVPRAAEPPRDKDNYALRRWLASALEGATVADVVAALTPALDRGGESWILTAEFAQGPEPKPGTARWWVPGDELPDDDMTEAVLHLRDGWVRVAKTVRGVRAACARYAASAAPVGEGLVWVEAGACDVRLSGEVAFTRGDWERFGLQRPAGMPVSVGIVVARSVGGDHALVGWHFAPVRDGGQ